MAKEIIGGNSEEGLSYSKCVRAGNYVFVSGMVGFGDDGKIVSGGIVAETRQILSDLRDVLKEAGCDLSHVVKANVCLPNPDDFEEFEHEYARWFSEGPPARATICAPLTIDAKIEIEATAYDGQIRQKLICC